MVGFFQLLLGWESQLYTPLKTNITLEHPQFLIGNTSSNGGFVYCHSLVFGGVDTGTKSFNILFGETQQVS